MLSIDAAYELTTINEYMNNETLTVLSAFGQILSKLP